MACDLIARVREIEDAYMALRARCAPGAPAVTAEPCIVPRLLATYQMAREIADGAATELLPRPEIPVCLSAEFLFGMKAWIEGITCGTEPDGYYYRHWLYFISTEGWTYDAGLGGALQGWGAEMTLNSRLLASESSRPGSLGLLAYLNDLDISLFGGHVASLMGMSLAGPPPDEDAEWARILSPGVSKWLYRIERYPPGAIDPLWPDPPLARLVLVSNLTDWDRANMSDPDVAEYRVAGTRYDINRYSQWTFDVPEDMYETF